MSKKVGMMLVLSSPSGAGKTTLAKMLSKNDKNYVISVSHTTRKPRDNEKDGQDYFFVSENKFKSLIASGSFYEHALIFDNYYGTEKDTVIKEILKGKDVLFDIDWQGTQQLKNKIKEYKLITIFILPPNIASLKSRLENRNQDGKEIAAIRMKKFHQELSHWNEYDYVVINNDLDTCYKQICSIIKLEKLGKKYSLNLKDINDKIAELTK